MNIPQYDYIDLTQEEFDAIVQNDPVMLRYGDRQRELEASITRFAGEEEVARRLVNEAQDKLDALHGEARAVERKVRELRGYVRTWINHSGTARMKIEDLARSRERREKELLHNEISRRLRNIGKDIKRGVRNMRAPKIFDLKDPRVEQPLGSAGSTDISADQLTSPGSEFGNDAPPADLGDDSSAEASDSTSPQTDV